MNPHPQTVAIVALEGASAQWWALDFFNPDWQSDDRLVPAYLIAIALSALGFVLRVLARGQLPREQAQLTLAVATGGLVLNLVELLRTLGAAVNEFM